MEVRRREMLAFIGAMGGYWALGRKEVWGREVVGKEAGGAAPDYERWEGVLRKYVRVEEEGVNLVDYRGLSQGGLEGLEAVVRELEAHAARLEEMGSADQFAYWVNLYNAVTLLVVAKRYPVSSIRDIDISGVFRDGPWKAKVIEAGGRELSLDDVEHGILRKWWRDERVHYAVNCASLGCPDLLGEAWRGEGLEGMLESSASAYVNSGRGAWFEGDRLWLSGLYKWYREDFGGDLGGVLGHVRRYARGELKERLGEFRARKVKYGYDWALNDAAV